MDIFFEMLKDFLVLVKNELLRTISVSFAKWILSKTKEKTTPLLTKVRGWFKSNN